MKNDTTGTPRVECREMGCGSGFRPMLRSLCRDLCGVGTRYERRARGRLSTPRPDSCASPLLGSPRARRRHALCPARRGQPPSSQPAYASRRPQCLPSYPSPPSFAHAGTASPPVSPSPTLNPPPAPFLTPLLLALRGPRPGKVGHAIGSRGSLGRAVRAFGEAARLAPADADLQASLLEARRAYSRAQS